MTFMILYGSVQKLCNPCDCFLIPLNQMELEDKNTPPLITLSITSTEIMSRLYNIYTDTQKHIFTL